MQLEKYGYDEFFKREDSFLERKTSRLKAQADQVDWHWADFLRRD